MKHLQNKCLIGLFGLAATFTALGDTVQYYSSPSSYPRVTSGLLMEYGTASSPPDSETAQSYYEVLGSGTVTLTYRFHDDTGSFYFNFGYYYLTPSLNAIDTSTDAGQIAYATAALAPGNAFLVFDDRVDNPGTVRTATVPGGTTIGFFLIPDARLAQFQTAQNTFALNGVGSETFGRSGLRRWPFFGLSSANPGGMDQLMSFGGISGISGRPSSLFAYEDLTRASIPGNALPSDNAFNDLIFAVEGVLPTCTVSCGTNIVTKDITGAGGVVVNYALPVVTPSCGSVTCVPPPGTFFAVGTNVVTCSLTNNANCSFLVVVQPADNLPPVAVCKFIRVSNDVGACWATVRPEQVDAGSYDPERGPVTLMLTPPGPYAVGTNVARLTVTDTNGLSAGCMATVVVEDAEAPSLTCPPGLAQATDPGMCSTTVGFVTAATDNCSLTLLVCEPPSGSVFPKGETTVACIASDTSQNTSQCAFKVTVVDAEVPVIICPADITMEFADEHGAPVTFDATATDNCNPNPLVQCVPPSGSVFPIGSVTVRCTATDASGNQAACRFQVTVQGAQGTKDNILVELTALRDTVQEKPDQEKLDKAIYHLTKSIDPDLWVDEDHLAVKHGDKVFKEEAKAVHELEKLKKEKKSEIADAVVQGFIDRLVEVDRLLAVVGIEAARQAGAKPKKLEHAQKEMDKAAKELAKGHYAQAIEHYGHAWKTVMHGKITGFKGLPDGTVRLEYIGNPGVKYQIKVSSNLVDWMVIATVAADADGVLVFDDPSAKGANMRYYQVAEMTL